MLSGRKIISRNSIFFVFIIVLLAIATLQNYSSLLTIGTLQGENSLLTIDMLQGDNKAPTINNKTEDEYNVLKAHDEVNLTKTDDEYILLKSHDKYNLLILVNDPYMNLALIFLNSLHQNTNMSNIGKIFVKDIGMSAENEDMLVANYPKIEILDGHHNYGFTKVHSKQWLDSLTQKTKTLLEITQNQSNLPLVMIDTDMVVMEDFDHLIDKKYDLQVCKRKFPSPRRDLDLILKYIASFFVVNRASEKATQFIKDWIHQMDEMYRRNLKPAYETPSMCQMIEKYQSELQIGELDEVRISSNCKYVEGETHIIHMKSVSSSTTLMQRLDCVSNFPKEKILQYLPIRHRPKIAN